MIKRGDWVRCRCSPKCTYRGVVAEVKEQEIDIAGHVKGSPKWTNEPIGARTAVPYKPHHREKLAFMKRLIAGDITL